MNVKSQMRHTAVAWRTWLLSVLTITGFVGMLMVRSIPSTATIGWICFFVGIAALIYQPRYGVYLIISLGLVGDAVLIPWFPFVKNLSSAESLLYIGRVTSFSPTELYIALTYLSWLARAAMQRKLKGYTGPLFWPALIFASFVTFGLVYGLTHHGDSKIALWEVRVIYYLPAMLILTSNLIETRAHVNILIWVIVVALFVDGIMGAWFVATVLKFNISSVEAIAEHSESIHLNSIFVLALAVWLYRGSRAKRIIMPLMLPVLLISYIANQRRAAFLTMSVALILLAIVLYRENRKAFWRIVPIAAVMSAIYLAAYWNSSGGLGQPARAIRSVVSPQQGSRDDASNVYRVIENVNTMLTIKSHPLTGVGFGNQFYIIVPMPDISFTFAWWQYITHNSIMWIWMQTGIGGFLSMIFLVGMAIVVGTRVMWRMPGGDMSAIALMATLYIVMHFIYAYADMSWEAQSMLYIGTMMGLINCMERVVDKSMLLPQKRWPWQLPKLSISG